MNFIYEGMSPEELAAKRAELESELMAAQFEHEFESVQMMHELRLKDIEKQIILENCSIEKVADLYANEEDLYTEAEGGILTKFFNWLSGIIKAIFGVTGSIKVDPAEKDETIELGVDVKALNAGSKSILQNLRDLTKIRDANGKLNLGAIVIDSIAAIGAVKGIGAFISAVKKKSKLTKGEAKTEADQLAKASADIRAELERINNTIKEDGNKKDITQLTSLVKVIESTVTEIKEKIGIPDNKDESKPANSSDNGVKDEPSSNGGNDGKNDAAKDDGKKDDSQKNGNNGGSTAEVKPSSFPNIVHDKSLSEGERVDKIVNSVKANLHFDDHNIDRSKDVDFNRYKSGAINKLKKMANEPRNYPPREMAIINAAIEEIEKIKHEAGDNGKAGTIPFSDNQSMDSHELAIMNLKKQIGYDHDTKTAKASKEEIEAYNDYYRGILDDGMWNGANIADGSRVKEAVRTCVDILTNGIKQNSKDGSGNQKAQKGDKLFEALKKDLQLYEKDGKWLIGVDKTSYKTYVSHLEGIISSSAKDKSKKGIRAEAENKKRLAAEYARNTDDAANTGDTTAWNKGGHIDRSTGRDADGNLTDEIKTSSSLDNTKKTMEELKSSVAEGGLALVFDGNDVYSRELKTEAEYDAAVKALETKASKFKDGDANKVTLNRRIKLAKEMRDRIFGTPAGGPTSAPAKSNNYGERFANYLINVFKAEPVNLPKNPTNEDYLNADYILFSKYKGDERDEAFRPNGYGNAHRPEWSYIAALQATRVYQQSADDPELKKIANTVMSKVKQYDYPKWMVTKIPTKNKKDTISMAKLVDIAKKNGAKVA